MPLFVYLYLARLLALLPLVFAGNPWLTTGWVDARTDILVEVVTAPRRQRHSTTRGPR
ncbi:hypothetical protein IIA16_01150, partial [bacterium]|nr:hypothetical protein [bacterium]